MDRDSWPARVTLRSSHVIPFEQHLQRGKPAGGTNWRPRLPGIEFSVGISVGNGGLRPEFESGIPRVIARHRAWRSRPTVAGDRQPGRHRRREDQECGKLTQARQLTKRGGMGERLIPAVLKTVVPERVPGVRIPLPPPFSCFITSDTVQSSPAINTENKDIYLLYRPKRYYGSHARMGVFSGVLFFSEGGYFFQPGDLEAKWRLQTRKFARRRRETRLTA